MDGCWALMVNRGWWWGHGDLAPGEGPQPCRQQPREAGPPRDAHLVASQLESDGDVNGLVDDADHRAHQRHEEQREPDDGHEEQDDEATHAVLDNLLLLLPLGLRVFLGVGSKHRSPTWPHGGPWQQALWSQAPL